MAYKFDSVRFNSTLEKMGRAIYYHHYNKKWPYPEIVVRPTSAIMPDLSPSPDLPALAIIDSTFLPKRHGENQDVFYYQVNEKFPAGLLKFVFYEGFVVYLLPNTRIVPPG